MEEEREEAKKGVEGTEKGADRSLGTKNVGRERGRQSEREMEGGKEGEKEIQRMKE